MKKHGIASAENNAGELRRKKKRKAQLMRLLGLTALCVILAVTYAVVAPLLSEEEEDGQTEDTSIAIINREASDVLSVSYTPKGGDTVSLSYDSASSKWIRTDDAEYPLAQSAVTSMAAAVAQITAEREIVDAGELSVYGLDDPSLTVSVSHADGLERVYKIGDYNEYIECYYMCIDGAASVYTVTEDMVLAFDYTVDELITLETLPSGTGITFTSYSVTMPGEESNTYSDETLLELLGELAITGWEKYKPTDEDIAAYGLDSDSAVEITVNYDEEKSVTIEDGSSSATSVTVQGSYKLIVGALQTDDNDSSTTQRLIRYNGSNIVYTADSSILDTLISGVAPETNTAETTETDVSAAASDTALTE